MSMTSNFKQHKNYPTAPAVQSVLTLKRQRNQWIGLGCVFQAIVGGAHLSMAGILTDSAKNNHLTLHKILTNPATIAAKHGNLTQNGTLQEAKIPLTAKFPSKEEKLITQRIHGYLKDQMQHHQNEMEEEDEEEDPWSEEEEDPYSEEEEEIEEEEDKEEEDHGEEIFVSEEEEEEEDRFHNESVIDKHDEEEEDEEEVDELEEEHHDEAEFELENTHEERGEEEHEGNFFFLNSLKYAVELLWVDDETGEKHPALLDGEHIIPPNKKVDISTIHGHVFHAYPAGDTDGAPLKTFQVDKQSFGLELDMEL